MSLIDEKAGFNRREIMREAYRAFRLRRDKGMTFSDALKFAWRRAHEARDRRLGELAAFQRMCWAA